MLNQIIFTVVVFLAATIASVIWVLWVYNRAKGEDELYTLCILLISLLYFVPELALTFIGGTSVVLWLLLPFPISYLYDGITCLVLGGFSFGFYFCLEDIRKKSHFL